MRTSQGRRFEKTVNATNTTRFVYDEWAMIHEESLTETNSYVYGLDLSGSRQGAGTIGGLVAVIKGGANSPSEPYFPCYDANGNVTDYVTTNGTVVAHYAYDAYGNITATAGSKAKDFSFRFSTKYFDSETGLLYYGYRYYSPELGRWLGRDPIEEKGGLNLYAFVGNRLMNGIDPFGLKNCCPDELSAVGVTYTTCATKAIEDRSSCENNAAAAKDLVLNALESAYEGARSELDSLQSSCESDCNSRYDDDPFQRSVCKIACEVFFGGQKGVLFSAYWANVGVAGGTYVGLVASCQLAYSGNISTCDGQAWAVCSNF